MRVAYVTHVVIWKSLSVKEEVKSNVMCDKMGPKLKAYLAESDLTRDSGNVLNEYDISKLKV